jgi:hypothetical protein
MVAVGFYLTDRSGQRATRRGVTLEISANAPHFNRRFATEGDSGF